MLLQDEFVEGLLKMKSGLSKTAKERRTVQWKPKISEKLCALKIECATRHAVLQKYAEFVDSEYEEEGVYDLVMETCDTVTNWLEKEVVGGGANVLDLECIMRKFYLDLITGFLLTGSKGYI